MYNISTPLLQLYNKRHLLEQNEIVYPDIVRFFNMLDRDGSNELIVGEEMNHVYPLFPIQEAVSADSQIFRAVMR